jgi:hypothetical protein
MKMIKKLTLCAALILTAGRAGAVDIWEHPEVAEARTLFLNVSAAVWGFPYGKEFALRWPSIDPSADYMLPTFLPLSAGVYVGRPKALGTVITNFGVRAAYHVDFGNPRMDSYLLYVYEFGYINNKNLIDAHYDPVRQNLFDFRLGLRYIWRSSGIFIETGTGLESIIFGVTIKL